MLKEFDSFKGLYNSKEFYQQHLDRRRYITALTAYEKITSEIGENTSPITLGILLDEQYQTQLTLSLIRATSNTPPSEIVGVNQIHPPRTLRTRSSRAPVVLEIMGPPALGKTTLITNTSKLYEPHLSVHEEVAQRAKPSEGDPGFSMFLRQTDLYEANKLTMNDNLFLELINARGKKEPVRPTLADRWLIDNSIFGLARFLHGDIYMAREHGLYAHPLSNLDEILNYYEEDKKTEFYGLGDENPWFIQYGIINCLAAPDVSLKRTPPQEEKHKVITPEFLPTLYEQYLRFHAEMLQHSRPFLYAALDLSQESEHENQTNFNTVVSKMIDFYTPFQEPYIIKP